MRSRFPASLRVIGRSFVDWWDGWLDMVMLMTVWFLAQITVIFGPPATFGLYYVVSNMINGQALGVKGLIEGARKYFGKAWLWGILNLVITITLFVNIQFYAAVEATWGIYLLIIVAMLGMLWYCTQFYALPYFMEQEDQRLRVALRNGLFTTLAAPLFTLVIIIFVLIVVVFSSALVIPFFLGLPGLVPMLGFRALNHLLIAFGIRKPEKTPKEIEFEQGGRMNIPSLDRVPEDSVGAAGGEVTQGEADGKKEE